MSTKINQFFNLPCEKLTKYNKALSYLLLSIGLILVVRYQIRLLYLVEWGDESETIIVTKMMAKGYRLYTEVYNNHGPLVFLPGLIISNIGKFEIPIYRIPIMLLQLCAILSVFLSPIFKNKIFRNYFTIIFSTVMLVFYSKIFGHTYLYQVISGLLVVIVLMTYTIPILMNMEIKKYLVFLNGFLLGCIPFLGIIYLPMVLILLLISFKKDDSLVVIASIIIASTLNIWFLLTYGSFDGYLAYHFYLNSNVLNKGIGILGYIKTIYYYFTTNFLHFLSIVFVFVIVTKLNRHIPENNYWKSFLIIPMMMSLVIRGGNLFDLSGLVYLLTLLALSSVLFINSNFIQSVNIYFNELPLSILTVLCVIVLFLPIPEHYLIKPFLEESDFSRIAKVITTEEEKVLALTFRSYEYLLADRLPASTHFIYLSIQAKYNKNPYKNIYVSITDDVVKNKPKIILIDKWNIVLDESDLWENYASDLMKVVYRDYYQLKNTDIYIRNDVNLLDYGLDPYYGYEIKE